MYCRYIGIQLPYYYINDGYKNSIKGHFCQQYYRVAAIYFFVVLIINCHYNLSIGNIAV